jgi:tRNA(Ile)-lysidine synthase
LLLEPQRLPASLSRAALARLPAERLAEVLRLWLQESGARPPSRAKLAEVTRQLVGSGSSHARVRHDGRWLLRYRDRIDMADTLPDAVVPTWFRWRGESLLEVAGHRFAFRPMAAGVDAGWLAQAELLLDRPCGADRLRRRATSPSRSWKNLAQESGVPPWLRQALPVLRWNAKLLYAAHFGMNCPAAARPVDEPPPGNRVVIEWLAPASWSRWL